MKFEMNNEVTDSIKDAARDKLNTYFYGLYVLFWSVFHWDFLVTLFFVSEDKIYEVHHQLKTDYLHVLLFEGMWWPYLKWIFPGVISYAVIRYLSKWFLLPLFHHEEGYRTEKRRIQIDYQISLIEKEKRLEEVKKEKLEVIKQKVETQKEIGKEDPTFSWEKDYREFEGTIFFNQFNLIVESIFKYSGGIHFYKYDKLIFDIPVDLLAYCDSNELISFASDEVITLEPKGKFFVKKFSARNRLRILDAKYGKGDKFVYITEQLNSRIKNGRLEVAITNQLAEHDPTSGVKKEAIIMYEYDGNIGKVTVPEGQALVLPDELPTGPEDFADYQ